MQIAMLLCMLHCEIVIKSYINKQTQKQFHISFKRDCFDHNDKMSQQDSDPLNSGR